MNKIYSGLKDQKKSIWILCGAVGCLLFLILLLQTGKLPDANAETDDSFGSGIAGLTVFLCGDANYDDIVNVGDVVYLVGFMYRGGNPPDPLEAGDTNNDLVVDVGDVVYLINYLYRGGSTPICFPQPETYAFDSLAYEMELLGNSICDTGVTNVIWFTPVIPKLDTATTVQGDTVTFHSRCFFQTPDGTYWRFPLPLGLTTYPVEEIGKAEESNQWTVGLGFKNSKAGFHFHGAKYQENGGPLQTLTIDVEGNRIQVGSKVYFFNYPSPLDPSLYEQLREAYLNQPPRLTDSQITTACNEGAISISNCHIVSVTYNPYDYWQNGDVWCYHYTFVTFTFEHAWTYYCPYGPLQRRIIVRFEGKELIICGSQTLLDEEFSCSGSYLMEPR